MGPSTVLELVKELSDLTKGRMKWKYRDTIMIDVFMRKERHIVVAERGQKKLEECGPKDMKDLQNHRTLSKLERVLPVLNGLLY